MNRETKVMQDIMLRIGRGAVRVFRQNVGVGWVGRVVARKGRTLILEDARPLHAGLCVGSSDLIGWRTVEVTPDMVGRRLAVFLAIEAKADDGATTDDQETFGAAVVNAGGIFIVARSAVEAEAALASWAGVDNRRA